MTLEQSCGDSQIHRIPLVVDGRSYVPADGDSLIFTAKNSINDTDADAVFQKTLGNGITLEGSIALVETVFEDTGTHPGGTLVFDIQIQLAVTGKPKTAAKGTLVLDRDVTRLLQTSVEVHTSQPGFPSNPVPAITAAPTLSPITGTEEVPSLVGGILKKSTYTAIKAFVLSGLQIGWGSVTGKPAFGGASLLEVGATPGTVAAGDAAPNAHTHVSADISDAASGANPANAGKVVKHGTDGNLVGYTANENGSAIYGVGAGATTSGVKGFSSLGTGMMAKSSSGTYHQTFGDNADDRSFVARLLGAFGWCRGAYTLMVSAVDTLTANRVQRFPDKDGTVALTSDITGTNSGTNTGDETGARIATLINAATPIATLADDDRIGGTDTSASGIIGYITGTVLWTWIKAKIDAGQTWAGVHAFSSTTRPTSAGTGTPASNSLITSADVDNKFPKAGAYKSVDQTALTATAYNKITFDVEEYDTHGAFESSTFTAPVAGYVVVACQVFVVGSTTTDAVALYKNGSQIKRLANRAVISATLVGGSAVVKVAAGDTLEIYYYTAISKSITGAATISWVQFTMIP